MRDLRFAPVAIATLVLSACGSDDDPDTSMVDTTPPTLVGSSPRAMAEAAPARGPITLFFSEPMDTAAGTVAVEPGTDIPAEGAEWDAGQVLTVRPPLEPGRTYTVRLRGFRDVAQNPLGEVTFLFGTAAVLDEIAPRLLATMPADGAADVPESLASLRFTFTEPMDAQAGEVSLTAGTASVGASTWSSSDVLDVAVSGLTGGESYAFALSGFQDAAGNALASTAAVLGPDGALDFSVAVVADTTPPTVVSSMPIEGAPNASPNLTTVSLSFSEAMDPTPTGATLTGGMAPVTLTGSWSADQRTVTFPVSLVGGTTYGLQPMGFRDLAGNALDAAVYLGNGVLDFTTEVIPDMDPPAVMSSVPAEGASNVPVSLSEIRVVFDEAMSPSMTQLVLEDTTRSSTTALTGVWSMGNTVLTAGVSGLALGRSYRVDLRGLQDAAMNALDPSPQLGDGYLDFSTPPDMQPPAVVTASPNEGASDVLPNLQSVTVLFNEPVDPATLSASLTGGMTPSSLSGTLNAAQTEVTYDVSSLIEPGTSYAIDLTGVQDLAGNTLALAPVLGDGVLNFTAPPAPSGFDCAAPLTAPYGTPLGNGFSFSIPSGTTGRNGSFLCDDSGSGDDVVIEYTKTTGTLANGGLLLRARVQGTSGLNVEVFGGACSPGPMATREKCYWNKDDLDVILDVPAGTYYIWVSNTNDATSATFAGATVSVEEIPASSAEGEGCWQPYTTTSPNYAPPASPGEPGTWSIGPTAINSFDMDVTWGGSGSISCDDTPGFGDIHGVDAVVEYTPTQMGSILVVTAQSRGTGSTADINVEILDRCDSTSPGKISLGCSADALSHELVTTSTSPVYIWVSTEATSYPWPGVDLSVREIVPQAGESCPTGRTIGSPGTIMLANQSTQNLGAPSCLASGGNPVEWYRYTVSGGRVQITSNGSLPIGVIEENGTLPERCREDISSLGYGALVPVGTTLCIAVPTGGGANDFTLSDLPDMYTGVGTSTSAISVTPATSWNTDYWMTSSPQWIYFGRSAGDVQRFPSSALTSTQASTAVEVFSTSSQVGYAGYAFGDERVFSLDGTTSTSNSRLYRVWDGSSASFSGSAWDLTPSYPSSAESRALTYDGSRLLYATHRSGTTDIYAVPDSMAQSPTLLGSNDTIDNVVGLAADATYLYFAAESVATGVTGIYRLPRSDLASSASPARLVLATPIHATNPLAVVLDDPSSPSYLYLRSTDSNEPNTIQVVESPGALAPILRGAIARQGASTDYAWTYDASRNVILFYDSTQGGLVLLR